MSRSMTLYNALSAISVPPDKATAVVEAWEDEMKTVASKSDLIRVEKQLVQKTIDLGRELRGSIKEISDTVKTHTVQINTLSQAIVTQGTELRAEMKEQGSELRASIEKQGNEFRLCNGKTGQRLLSCAGKTKQRISTCYGKTRMISGLLWKNKEANFGLQLKSKATS